MFTRLKVIGAIVCVIAQAAVAGKDVRILRGEAVLPDGQRSLHVAVDSVVPERTVFLLSYTLGGFKPGDVLVMGNLATADTLSFSRAGDSGAVSLSWQLVEFAQGVRVQRGTTTIAAAASATVTIDSVDLDRSFPLVQMNGKGSHYGMDEALTAELTAPNRLFLALGGDAIEVVVGWQVVEYEGCSVQKVYGTLAADSLLDSAALNQAVDPARSMVVGSYRQNGLWRAYVGIYDLITVSDMPVSYLADNGSAVVHSRSAGGRLVQGGHRVNFVDYVVSFSDGAAVTHGTQTIPMIFGTGDTTLAIPVTHNPATSVVTTPGIHGRQARCDTIDPVVKSLSSCEPSTQGITTCPLIRDFGLVWFALSLSEDTLYARRQYNYVGAMLPYQILDFQPTTEARLPEAPSAAGAIDQRRLSVRLLGGHLVIDGAAAGSVRRVALRRPNGATVWRTQSRAEGSTERFRLPAGLTPGMYAAEVVVENNGVSTTRSQAVVVR